MLEKTTCLLLKAKKKKREQKILEKMRTNKYKAGKTEVKSG